MGQEPHLRHAEGRDLLAARPARVQRRQIVGVLQGSARGLRDQPDRSARSRRAIARFWSDDAMLTPTPPGHWVSIALQILDRDGSRAREERRCPGASRHRAGRCVHRLLGGQVPVRSGAADHLHPPLDRPEMGAAAQHAALSRISERPQHAVRRRGGGADQRVRRQFRLRGHDPAWRRPEAAELCQLQGGRRRSGHLEALRRHPFSRGNRAWPGAGPLHRRLCELPCAQGDRPCVPYSWPLSRPHWALPPSRARPLPPTPWPYRPSSRKPPSAGIDSAYAGEWQYMVGGGVATFDCNDDGFDDMLLAGGTSPAKFYRNASTRGGALKFEAETSGLELDKVTGAYPLDVDSDGVTDLVLLRVGENVVMRGTGGCRFERANELWSFDGGDAWSTALAATWERGAAWPTVAIGNYIDRQRRDFALGVVHRQLAAQAEPRPVRVLRRPSPSSQASAHFRCCSRTGTGPARRACASPTIANITRAARSSSGMSIPTRRRRCTPTRKAGRSCASGAWASPATISTPTATPNIS